MSTIQRLFAVAVVIVMFVFGIGGSSAYAQDGTPPNQPTQPANDPNQPNQPKRPPLGGRLLQNYVNIVLDTASKSLSMDRKDLQKELMGGKTLTEIITAKGGDVAKIKADVTAAIKADIDQAVTDETITQAQADVLLKALEPIVEATFTRSFNRGGNIQERRIQTQGYMFLLQATADATGINQRDLLQELRNNKSLAQIATEKNADVTKIIDAAVTKATEQINQMVKNERIKQDEADKMLATLKDDLTKLMNQTGVPVRPNNGNNNGNKGNNGDKGNQPGATPEATPAAGL